MKPLAKIYAIIVSFVGIIIGIFCVYAVVNDITNSKYINSELFKIVMLFILAYLCRCLPIYIRQDLSIDMSFISIIAMILCKGSYVATAIIFVSSIFVVMETPGPEKKVMHIFNTAPLKTAFNSANYCISVFLGGKVFLWTGGIIGNLMFPGLLLPLLAMIFTIILTNSVLLILLFKLNLGTPFYISVLKYLLEFIPSLIASAPIGYFIAKFMLMDSGEYLVILFILPLLLARFSFSLYVDVKQNYYVMLKTLTHSLEAKDDYTRGHSERVESYAKTIALEMRLSNARIENISVAALLHDIGKIGIDESILRKPARLTPEERCVIQKHPEISVSILKEVKLAPLVFEMILHHHERYDGKGYPAGKGGDELPIEVYILGVADTYDAVTSTRPYSEGSSPERAKEIIFEEKGKQFHPKVVDAFLRAFDSGNLGLIERDAVESQLIFK